jgi:Glycine-rich domain-containing protein-like
MYPSEPFQLFEVFQDIYRGRNPFFARLTHVPQHHTPASTTQPRFGLNLSEAVIRQWDFSKKITNIYLQDPLPCDLLDYGKRRYVKFMNLLRFQRNMIVPTSDIDLFWHTHQLSSHKYQTWCVQQIGRPINHDDTVEGSYLSNGLETTKQLWAQTYAEDYLSSTPQFPSLQPQDNPKIIHPPQGLSPVQMELWAFDLDRQKRHDEFAYKLLQLGEQRVIALGTLEDELKAAKINQHAAGNAFDEAYRADMLARAAAMSRPGTHPDLPPGWENKGTIRRLIGMQKYLAPIIADKSRNRVKAIERETFVVQELESRIRLIKDPFKNCQSAMESNRNEWRKQRIEILRRTGAIGTPERKEEVFMGFNRTIPAIQPVIFPLYAASWYRLWQTGPYNYSLSLSKDMKFGKAAGGFKCGALMNYGKIPEPISVEYSCRSCGSGG